MYKVWVYRVYGWQTIGNELTLEKAHEIYGRCVGRAYIVDVVTGLIVDRNW